MFMIDAESPDNARQMPVVPLGAVQDRLFTELALEGVQGWLPWISGAAAIREAAPMLMQKARATPARTPAPENRRRSQRRVLNRPAKIHFGFSGSQRDCIVTDISDGGVRLRVEGIDVPDEFVLLLAGDGHSSKERAYKVVWRLGAELGAKFLGHPRRSGNYVKG